MRIRKNAKVSPAVSTANYTCDTAELLQPHVCRLNQSPWDEEAITQNSPNNKTVSNIVLEDYSCFTRNRSLGVDSIGASDTTTTTTIDVEEDKNDNDRNGTETTIIPVVKKKSNKKRNRLIIIDDENNNNNNRDNGDDFSDVVLRKKRKLPSAKVKKLGKRNVRCCQKNDGKGWQCKKEAKEGCNFCEHHLSQFRSYNNNTNSNIPSANYISTPADTTAKPVPVPSPATAPAPAPSEPATTGRKRRPASANSNPNEFYYYSGFGPRWGRKRSGGRAPTAVVDDAGDNGGGEMSGESSPRSSSMTIDDVGERNRGLGDYLEEEEDDDDEDDDDDDVDSTGGGGGGDDGGRRRVRRPVKARSLKSLM